MQQLPWPNLVHAPVADPRRPPEQGPMLVLADPIRIVIAHGQRLLGEALAELLTNEPGFAVVGQAPDSQSAFRLAKQTLPTIVLLDLDTSHQPEHTVRQLLQVAPAPRVIILSNHADPGS